MATTQELLAQSTATAQKAAQMIGGTFTQGVGFQPAQTATTPSGAVVNTNTGALVAPKSNIVPSSSLKPSTNPALQDPPTTRQPYDISSLSSIEDQAAAFAARFQEPTTPEDTQKTTIEDKLLAAYEKFNGSSAFKSKAMADAGIPEIDTNIKSVTAQITQLQKESEALKLANRVAGPGGAMTATALNAKDAEIERQRASKALMLSAALDGYNADLASAKSKVETMLENEFGPAQDEIDYLTKQLEIVKERGTAAQKKSAATQEIALAERQRLLDEAKTIKADITDTVIEAAKNGAPASVLNKISSAKTIMEAITAASGYTQKQATPEYRTVDGVGVVQIMPDGKYKVIVPEGAKQGEIVSGFADVMQASIDAGNSPEQAARDAAAVSESYGVPVSQAVLDKFTEQARKLKKTPAPVTETAPAPIVSTGTSTRTGLTGVSSAPKSTVSPIQMNMATSFSNSTATPQEGDTNASFFTRLFSQ